MSTLNLPLQDVSPARAPVDPDLKVMVQNKATLNFTDLQQMINKSPALASVIRDSMSPVIHVRNLSGSMIQPDEVEGIAHSMYCSFH